MLKPPTRKTLEIDLAIEAVLDLSALLSRKLPWKFNQPSPCCVSTVVEKTGAPWEILPGKPQPQKSGPDPESIRFGNTRPNHPHTVDHITPEPPILNVLLQNMFKVFIFRKYFRGAMFETPKSWDVPSTENSGWIYWLDLCFICQLNHSQWKWMNLGMMLVLQKEPHVSWKHWGTFHSCQAEKQEVAVTDLAFTA